MEHDYECRLNPFKLQVLMTQSLGPVIELDNIKIVVHETVGFDRSEENFGNS